MTLANARARILLAEDNSAMLAQEVRVLSREYDIVGTAATGVELLTSASRLHPDVIVLDVSMPDMNGFEAARQLRDEHCASHLVFVSTWEDGDYVHNALDLGAEGYVLKSRLASDLVPAVHAVMAGEQFVSPIAKG